MAKVPKHRRIKRATVLIKRIRCIKNTKSKTHAPFYQKLKVNNVTLAKALAQERQECRMLFTRNNELLAENQDLYHECNKRDHVISNVLKNAKELMQLLVTMSGFLTNTISTCQEFVNTNRSSSSSSSAGRRESTRRSSTKSPARGVVKPMVSGHTITKPTINLSRVNMQRLQNPNLSMIEEGSSTPERSSDGSVESRHSRPLSERMPVPVLSRTEVEEERILNRRTRRYSGGRLSSGRYSKRNSLRLSNGSVAGRLSKRISDSFELTKSPRVTLQDVSRYLSNSQTVNVRLLSETSNGNNSSNSNSPENSQLTDQSSPEDNNQEIDQANQAAILSDPQADTASDSEHNKENVAVLKSKKSTARSEKRSVRFQSPAAVQNTVAISNYDPDDPLEGSSWMHSFNNSLQSPNDTNHSTMTMELEQQTSPVSSLSMERRRSSGYFRVPEVPKRFAKPMTPRINLNNEFDSLSSRNVTCGLDTSNSYIEESEGQSDENDEGERKLPCFVTQRRGGSGKASSRGASIHENNQDDDDEDDKTIILNIQRQLRPQQNIQQPQQSPITNERMQFDLNELLQATPLLSLINIPTNNGPVEQEPDVEPTVTVNLTQRCPPRDENTTTVNSTSSTLKINSQPAVRSQEITSSGVQERRFSELSTTLLNTRVELPRLTELHNSSFEAEENSQRLPTPDNSSKQLLEKRKRVTTKQVEVRCSTSDDNEEDEVAPKQKKKKGKQHKKKTDDKDPSTAKVVLQKLNESQSLSSRNESMRSDHRNSDENVSSTRNSGLSRVDISSDSESSTTSLNSKIPLRPRRQKAPTSFREPSLNKKLRR